MDHRIAGNRLLLLLLLLLLFSGVSPLKYYLLTQSLCAHVGVLHSTDTLKTCLISFFLLYVPRVFPYKGNSSVHSVNGLKV